MFIYYTFFECICLYAWVFVYELVRMYVRVGVYVHVRMCACARVWASKQNGERAWMLDIDLMNVKETD